MSILAYSFTLPLFSLMTMWSRLIGRRGVFISCISQLILLLLLVLNSLWTFKLKTNLVNLWDLYSLNDYLALYYNIVFNRLNTLFMLIVIGITLIIIIYSVSYLFTDKHLIRLAVILSLFSSSMTIFVCSYSYILLFVAWEHFGFISGILVNYWKNHAIYSLNAFKALIINRVGDYFLSLGIYYIAGTTLCDILGAIILSTNVNENLLLNNNWFYSLLFISVLSKSAQFPFFTWLYDAMSAPTPVSSLLHAATMVTAGSYLAILVFTTFSWQLYIQKSIYIFLIFVIISSVITNFISYFNLDIKRILAFSTSGQLGIIIIGIFINSLSQSYLHLITHALFKSILFLSVANLIHSLSDNQDLRFSAISSNHLSTTIFAIQFASLSMIGFPFLSGFYSKDSIIESAYFNNNILSYNIYLLLSISTIFTVIYTFKLVRYIDHNYNSNNIIQTTSLHQVEFTVNLIYVILVIVSLFIVPIFKCINIILSKYLLDRVSLFSYYTTLAIICILLSLLLINLRNQDYLINVSGLIGYLRLLWDFNNLFIVVNTLYISYFYALKFIDKQILPLLYTPTYYINIFQHKVYNQNIYPILIFGFILFTVPLFAFVS